MAERPEESTPLPVVSILLSAFVTVDTEDWAVV
jgi:hypothetical protein